MNVPNKEKNLLGQQKLIPPYAYGHHLFNWMFFFLLLLPISIVFLLSPLISIIQENGIPDNIWVLSILSIFGIILTFASVLFVKKLILTRKIHLEKLEIFEDGLLIEKNFFLWKDINQIVFHNFSRSIYFVSQPARLFIFTDQQNQFSFDNNLSRKTKQLLIGHAKLELCGWTCKCPDK